MRTCWLVVIVAIAGCRAKTEEPTTRPDQPARGLVADFRRSVPVGDFEIATDTPDAAGAKAIATKDGKGKWIRLGIVPHLPLGARPMLSFRYRLKGTDRMIVQMFSVTENDNRHVRLEKLPQGQWATASVDFARDSRRNDGSNTPFGPDLKIDDIFFFIEPVTAELVIDHVRLETH